MTERFLGWRRPALTGLATAAPAGTRLGAELPVTLSDDVNPPRTERAPFALAGVLDVLALSPGAVTKRYPAPGTSDAEVTMLPYVELAAADLPWRYSPIPHEAGHRLRPWLVLVVGEPGREVELVGSNRVRLHGPDLFDGHPLAQTGALAHAHVIPGHELARVLCPRPLIPGSSYLAVLVPGWRAGVQGEAPLVDAWPGPGGSPDVELPCFDRWSFRTVDEPDDFLDIARRLEPLTDAEQAALRDAGFGRARVGAGPAQPAGGGLVLEAGGALAAIAQPGDPPVTSPLPGDVAARTARLAGTLPPQGERWVLGLPRYDQDWSVGPAAGGVGWAWPPPLDQPIPAGWRGQLHEDPRHRGAAGLGAWAAISWQARIAEGATRQAGALASAASRIRHLVLGLSAARSLWAHRVPTADAGEGLERLAVLAPLLGRTPAQDGGTALDALAGRAPHLVPALLSAAARRALRPRGALSRSAAPGATRLAGLLAASSVCPPPQGLPDADARLIDAADPKHGGAQAAAARLHEQGGALLGALADAGVDEAAMGALARGLTQQGGAEQLTGIGLPRPPPETCRPVDLGAFTDAFSAGIDPTTPRPIVVERVVGTITGLREPVLAVPEVAPELDIPLWSFLSDASPDWLLPGGGDVPNDRVLSVATNPPFVEAFLLGSNHQTLAELRWRNIPVTTAWTPLRRFWQRIDSGATGVALDIRPVSTLAGAPVWTDASELGDLAHADGPAGPELVIVLHTELFRRYPSTLVYLVANPGGEAVWGDVPPVDPGPGAAPLPRVQPVLSGRLTPELVFFGFPVPPQAAASHWLVLEEPPPGFRFRRRDDGSLPLDLDGAALAADRLQPPARAFFGNLL